MKKALFLLSLCFIIYSCKQTHSPISMRQKAIDSVKAYLAKNLNDPSSYEPGDFDSLRKRISDYTFDDDYFKYKSWVDKSDVTNDMLKDIKLYEKREHNHYYDRLHDSGIKKIDSLKKSFKPKITGYDLWHRYRAKNGFGALTLHLSRFRLDTSLSVINVQDGDN